MGVFRGTWFALSRSIAMLRDQTFLDIGHTTIRNLGVPMSILMPLSLVSAIAVLVLLPKRSKAFALALTGFSSDDCRLDCDNLCRSADRSAD